MAKKGVSENKKFAVIKLAGSQAVVHEGDSLEVSRLEGTEGGEIKIGEVLMVRDGGGLKIGAPFVSGAEVSLKVVEHTKGEKMEIRKFKAKSRYRRKIGHRQLLSKVQVVKIKA